MQSPLCEMCLKNEDILCAGCQRRLNEGKITQTEVELSRALHALSARFKSVQAGGFKEAKELNNLILIIVPKGSAGKVIGRGGAIISELEKKMGKRVKIIENGALEDVVKDVVGRNELVGINKVFAVDGERYKVRIKRRAHVKKGEIEDIVRAVTGKNAEVVLE